MAKAATREELDKAEIGIYIALDPRFSRAKQATRLLARGNSTRMDALCERVAAQLAAGAQPEDVTVLCASPVSVGQLRARLAAFAKAQGVSAEGVSVCTPREVALNIMATPEAQAFISRKFSRGVPRLLSAFEVDFVMEDLKTIGIRPKRLQEVLKFLYRGWTELADEDTGWLVTVEEHDIVEFLQAELRYLQGILEPELSNLASKVLRAEEDVLAQFSRKFVFVYDYQNLSRASQLMSLYLAEELVAVAANPVAAAEVFESYPYLAGVDEVLDVFPAAQTINLDACEGETAGQASKELLSWDLPEDEIEGIAALVQADVTAGMVPNDIVVACFSPYWYGKVTRALKERALPVQGMYRPLVLKGDVRDLDLSLGLRMASVLRLMVNPEDSMSWRCCIGYGDYLTHSNSFVDMRKGMQAQRAGAVFAELADQLTPREGIEVVKRNCAGKTGRVLLEQLAKDLSGGTEAAVPGLLSVLLALGEDAGPSEYVAELERLQFFTGMPKGQGVTVASMETAISLRAKKLYIVGFVNGLFPRRRYFDRAKVSLTQQERMAKVDEKKALALFGVPSEQLMTSYFMRAEQAFADKVDLKQDRIFIEPDGTKYSDVSLSIHANVK